MDSQERDREDIGIIVCAIQEVQKIVTRAKKDGHNKFHDYDYVSEEGLVEQVRDAFIENGLLLTPIASGIPHVEHHTGDKKNRTHIVWKQGFHLAHTTGAIWPFELSVMCEGEDNGDKSVWKGLTNAHKHIVLKLLMLPTGLDPEADEETDKQNTGYLQLKIGPESTQPPIGQDPALPQHQAQESTPQKRHATPNAELEQWIMKVGPKHVLSNDDKRQWKIFGRSFAAADEAWGKDHKFDKFTPLNNFQAQWNIGRDNPMQAKDIPDYYDFVSQWPEWQKEANTVL